MKRLMLERSILLSLLLTFSIVHAQEPETEEVPEVRRYAVEVIIFRYTQAVGTGSEIFVPEVVDVEEIELRDTTPPTIELPTRSSFATPDTRHLVSDIARLEEDEYTMGEILDRLERLDVYEPVMHFGWQQSAWPDHDREAIELSRFAQPPGGLEGELTLYLSRFLHLIVDLQLEAPSADTGVVDDPMISYGDYRTLNEIRQPPAPVRYRIEEDRIFRSGELRYFDHPKFGVLAQVSRVEEEVEDSGDEELLGYPVE